MINVRCPEIAHAVLLVNEAWTKVLEMIKINRGKCWLGCWWPKRRPERKRGALGRHSMGRGACQSLLNTQVRPSTTQTQ